MKKKLILGVLLFAVLLAGCNTNSDNAKNSPSTKAKVGAQNTNVSSAVKELNFEKFFPDNDVRDYATDMIGKEAPNFTLTNLKGEEISLSDFKEKNVIVELGKTTCEACIKFQPIMDKFKAAHPDIPVIQAFPLENTETVKEYLATLNSPESDSTLTGEKGNTMVRDYKAKWTPTTYFINKDGIISFVYVGDAEIEFVEDLYKLAFE